MPRKARQKSESGIYHIIVRGINRQSIFENEEDKEKFIEVIEKYKEKCGYEIYGYCLMDNHVHILLKEKQETLSQIMKRISSSYVYWYNWKYQRRGHLFQERFKSEPVEDDSYLLTVLRYIHQNPLKAGLVKSLGEYKWSSYYEYIKENRIVDIELGLKLIAGNNNNEIESFIRFNNEMNNDVCMELQEKPVRVSDEELRLIVKNKYGIEAIQIQNEEKQKQLQILKELKEYNGVSLRQISRITGLSVHRIFKA